jgi:hypothetical protein
VSVRSLVTHVGKCSNCGREYHSKHIDDVVCDCWKICPLCDREMESYIPDLETKSYGLDGKRDLQILKVCYNLAGHSGHSPYFSILKPVEVELQ